MNTDQQMETKTVHLKLGFIGAGAVNFGGAEGPWDHVCFKYKLYISKNIVKIFFIFFNFSF